MWCLLQQRAASSGPTSSSSAIMMRRYACSVNMRSFISTCMLDRPNKSYTVVPSYSTNRFRVIWACMQQLCRSAATTTAARIVDLVATSKSNETRADDGRGFVCKLLSSVERPRTKRASVCRHRHSCWTCALSPAPVGMARESNCESERCDEETR